MPDELNADLFGRDVSYQLPSNWLAYWTFMLRLIVGFWFFHAGITKFLGAEAFDASGYLKFAAQGTLMEGVVAPFASGAPLALVNLMIPLGETLIGLGLLVGLLVRTASFFGVMLMVFFVTINVGWGHGIVNSDLMGLLFFVTMIVLGAGRVWGLDAIVEDTAVVKQNPVLRYFLG